MVQQSPSLPGPWSLLSPSLLCWQHTCVAAACCQCALWVELLPATKPALWAALVCAAFTKSYWDPVIDLIDQNGSFDNWHLGTGILKWDCHDLDPSVCLFLNHKSWFWLKLNDSTLREWHLASTVVCEYQSGVDLCFTEHAGKNWYPVQHMGRRVTNMWCTEIQAPSAPGSQDCAKLNVLLLLLFLCFCHKTLILSTVESRIPDAPRHRFWRKVD